MLTPTEAHRWRKTILLAITKALVQEHWAFTTTTRFGRKECLQAFNFWSSDSAVVATKAEHQLCSVPFREVTIQALMWHYMDVGRQLGHHDPRRSRLLKRLDHLIVSLMNYREQSHGFAESA